MTRRQRRGGVAARPTRTAAWRAGAAAAAFALLAGAAHSRQEAAGPAAAAVVETAPSRPVPAVAPGLPAGVRVLPSGGLRMETAALLLSGQQGGPLPLAIAATRLAAAGERVPVAVVMEVDGSDLLLEQGSGPLHLEVCVYALAAGGAVVGAVLQTVALDLAQLRDPLQAGGVRLVAQLALPPGEVSLRALVRNVGTDNLGVKILPFEVSPAGDGGPVPLALLFTDEAASWLVVPVGAPPAWPWAPAAAPSARPLLEAGKPARLDLVAVALPAQPSLRVELRRPLTGELLATVVPALEARTAGPGGVERLTLSAPLDGVGPGELELRVTGDGFASASPAVRVVVTELPVAGRSWAALAGGPPERLADAAAKPPERSVDHAGSRAIAAAFRDALAQLAGGDLDGARAALVEHETRWLRTDAIATEDLHELQVRAVTGLAKADREAVLPVLALYQELYRYHARRRASLPSTHAREMVFALAAWLGGEGATPAARDLAASALVAFAAELPANGSRLVLSRTLRQALALRARDTSALLALAVDAERNGEYPGALHWLQEILAVDPTHPEARLRLAINRARTGTPKRSVELLTELLDDAAAATTPPPWWLAIAHQELARLHVAAGQRPAAEAVLRRGLERLPGEEKLSLQLAVLLDSPPRRPEARSLLAAWAPTRVDRGFDAARNRYHQLPVELLRRAADDFRRLALARSGALATALRPREGAGG